MISEVYNEDCMVGMARYPDKFFDLAIVDPPYGINMDGQKSDKTRKGHPFKGWDKKIPDPSYFSELNRVSKNQVIWGGNYFVEFIKPKKGWIIWYKAQQGLTMSDCELAYSSFDKPARVFIKNRLILNQEKTIHPTQKPIDLYRWILNEYANSDEKILDTHLGSGSSRIAAHDMGLDFYGWELDKDYFDAMQLRYKKHISQQTLFKHEMIPTKQQQLNIGMDLSD